MDKNLVIETLRRHQGELRARGARSLYLFGSVARGEARAHSDVDLFFERVEDRPFTLFDMAELKERLEEMLQAKVDLMTRQAISSHRRAGVEIDALQVF